MSLVREDLMGKYYFENNTNFHPDENSGSDMFISGSFPIWDIKFPGVDLPGRQISPSRDSCGAIWQSTKCKNTGNQSVSHSWCYKSACPICYQAWAQRMGGNTAKKMYAYSQVVPLYHWTINFKDLYEHNLEYMKASVKKIFPDSFSWFHPYRLKDIEEFDGFKMKKIRFWKRGSHYHIISPIKFDENLVSQVFEQEDFLLKFHGKVKNSLDDFTRLISYELSHCGLLEKPNTYRAITHRFGIFSNSKFTKNFHIVELDSVYVKCACEECKLKYYHENRSDLLISPAYCLEKTHSKDKNYWKVEQKFEYSQIFHDYKRKEKIFIHKDMKDIKQYLKSLGVYRYLSLIVRDLQRLTLPLQSHSVLA